MRLTQMSRNHHADHTFPTTQLFILAICRVAEPIALTSIFPYSWLMVRGFNVGDRKDASFYAGLLISAFALAESLTGMLWGALSDRIGRKPVLLMGCMGTILSLLIVGFSRTFGMALAGRVLGGALNGNIGVIQTMVGELVKNPAHEPKAYAIMPFVWSIGTIMGPAVGGTFADPVKNFPSVFHQDSFFADFPWLLPNLICAASMFVSVVASYFFLEETHPDFCKGADPGVYHSIAEQTPMITAAGANADPGVDLRQESYGTFNEVDISTTEQWIVREDGGSPAPSFTEKFQPIKWFTWRVFMLVMSLGIFTYHSMCYDHLLPIFLQDERINDVSMLIASGPLHIPGGIGLSTKTVGLIMSINGLIALFVQGVVFPIATDLLGVWHTFVLVTIFHPIAYFVVPFIAFLPERLLFPGIYACLALRNLLSILAYPVLLILLKQASVSSSVLGRINGLAASVGAACRTIAPPVAGLLYSLGTDVGFTGLAWWGTAAAALLGTLQLYFVPRERENSNVRSLAACLSGHQKENDNDYSQDDDDEIHDVVRVVVQDHDDRV